VGESGVPRRIAGLSEIAADYRGLLCDVWGVLHNGVEAYGGAVDALCRFRDGGGRVILITNAPRPARQIREMLRGLQVPDAAYDAIVTSGDVTRNLLAERAGGVMFHLGPQRDTPVYEGFDFVLAGPERADFVLCTGPFNDHVETPEDYKELLGQMRARNLEMICANPDIIVERGGVRVYCAGALAQSYERMGGAVIYAGKPYAPIYDMASRLFAERFNLPPPKRSILAIGDSIRTDLRGASAAGLDMLFITSGIHADEGKAPDRLERMFADVGAPPRAILNTLVW